MRTKIRSICDYRMIYWYNRNSFFPYPGEETMKYTIQHNTIMGKIKQSVSMIQHHKSINPILYQNRLCKGFETNTVFL